jgi:hypothetical protein
MNQSSFQTTFAAKNSYLLANISRKKRRRVIEKASTGAGRASLNTALDLAFATS